MLDDVQHFYDGMKKVPGNLVELLIVPNANHDIFAGGEGMVFAKEAIDAVKVAKRFTEPVE